MRGPRVQTALLAAGLALWVFPAVAAVNLAWEDSTSQVPPLRNADELQSAVALLRQGAWALFGSQDSTTDERTVTLVSAQPPTDARGRTMQQDVNEQYLSPQSAARLDALLEAARGQAAAHQEAALHETLATARAAVLGEVHRGDLISNYWHYQADFRTQQQLIDDLQRRLPPEARVSQPPEIRTPLIKASTQLATALGASGSLPAQQAEDDQLRKDILAVLAAYTQLRTRLAGTVSANERLKGIAPLALERSASCSPPAARTSGKSEPVFDPATHPDIADYYPAAMRRVNVEGAVVVAATISATGCPLRAQVEYGSGVPQLDTAALHYALDARFLPAEHEQQPVQAEYQFRVRFRLED